MSNTIPISIWLTQISKLPPTIRVVLNNRSETDETYTLVTWGSPLDPLAGGLGLMEITLPLLGGNRLNGPLFPVPTVTLVNRWATGLLSAFDAFVTLPPGKPVSIDMVLSDHVDMAGPGRGGRCCGFSGWLRGVDGLRRGEGNWLGWRWTWCARYEGGRPASVPDDGDWVKWKPRKRWSGLTVPTTGTTAAAAGCQVNWTGGAET
ncbi:hypothetical protein B0H66DRAFT_594940 [Apodospora peruviana]|uniref:Uncharacterized protein n=1 Tax=Apodospora peruviana TaxID=516989 RepID=A0AAE0M096_9PEZI|nr:hypothetical protein B0H66DRAFT_594940 [Apodospora peruviana]